MPIQCLKIFKTGATVSKQVSINIDHDMAEEIKFIMVSFLGDLFLSMNKVGPKIDFELKFQDCMAIVAKYVFVFQNITSP